MASSSKKVKKVAAPIYDSSEETEAVDSQSESSTKKLCIICGERASKNIVKDVNYSNMLQLYWYTLIGFDVKPEACNKFDLCKTCFDKVVQYYETNDIMHYFENYFKSLRINLLKETLKGMATWEKSGTTVPKIHQEVKKKYGDQRDKMDKEEKQIKHNLNGYKVDNYGIIDSDDDEDSKSGPRKGIRIEHSDANESSIEIDSD